MARRKKRFSFMFDWDIVKAIAVGLLPFPIDSLLTYAFLKGGRRGKAKKRKR